MLQGRSCGGKIATARGPCQRGRVGWHARHRSPGCVGRGKAGTDGALCGALCAGVCARVRACVRRATRPPHVNILLPQSVRGHWEHTCSRKGTHATKKKTHAYIKYTYKRTYTKHAHARLHTINLPTTRRRSQSHQHFPQL